MNEKWPSWIHSSIAKYLDDSSNFEIYNIGVQPTLVPLVLEGQHKDEILENLDEWIELRVDFPRTFKLSPTYWTMKVEVNVLIGTKITSDPFALQKLGGKVANTISQSIKVYRYGPDADDDDSYLGCLQPIYERGRRSWLELNIFGQLHPQSKLQQATAEQHFEIKLTS